MLTWPEEPSACIDSYPSSLPWLVVAAVLVLTAAGTAFFARHWLAAGAWVALLLLLPDPVPDLLDSSFFSGGDRAVLLQAAGRGQGSTLPVLDLSTKPPTYAGIPSDQPLPALLAREGYGDFGTSTPEFRLPTGPWDLGLQRALQVLPPPQARCGDLVPWFATLRRFGVSVWLWPALPSEPEAGPLSPAFARPVVSVLTYPPTEPGKDRPPCWELVVEPTRAHLWDSRIGSSTPFELPTALEDLATAMAACDGSVVVSPREDTPVSQLFAVLDRVAGTHPHAHFRGSTALRWPGLDPPGFARPRRGRARL